MKDKDTQLLEEAYDKINEANPNYPIPDVVGGLATGDYSPRNILGQLSDDEIEFLKQWIEAEGMIPIYKFPELYDKLYDYFRDEMPYGVQKARTGDPEEWIADRLDQMFSKENMMNNEKVEAKAKAKEHKCPDCGSDLYRAQNVPKNIWTCATCDKDYKRD